MFIFPNKSSEPNMRSFLLLSLLLLSSTRILITNALNLDFDLIHRDSPLSPLYNSSSTKSQLTQQVMLRSMIHSKRRRHNHHLQTDTRPSVFFEGQGEYLMKLYIGSPPIETWAIADTGSDLIWVQCLPCDKCYPQKAPIFNPFKSSTYKIVSCHSKPCRSYFPKRWTGCGISTQCSYIYGYGGGSTTAGDLGRDQFSFFGVKSGEEALFLRRPLLLGCGHNNSGQFASKGSGLVGLGHGPLSLVSQLGPQIDHTFSYCLVPYFSKSTGKLKLGRQAKRSGSPAAVTTPFVNDRTNYYLTLEGITIGNKTLETSPKRKGNTLIDSGGTWFLIETDIYTEMEALIKKAIRVKEVRNPPEPLSLCYPNKYSKTIKKNFPKFVVHFEGADIALKPDENIFFHPHDDLLCLGILPNDSFDYGNLPQVNFQVEYDLEAKKISFAHSDCSKH